MNKITLFVVVKLFTSPFQLRFLANLGGNFYLTERETHDPPIHWKHPVQTHLEGRDKLSSEKCRYQNLSGKYRGVNSAILPPRCG